MRDLNCANCADLFCVMEEAQNDFLFLFIYLFFVFFLFLFFVFCFLFLFLFFFLFFWLSFKVSGIVWSYENVSS